MPKISIESSVCDVRDKKQVEQAIQQADILASSSAAAAAYPSFSVASILVNCAGITRDGRVTNLSNDDWDDVLDINLKGTFLMCKNFCEPSRAATLLKDSGTTNNNIAQHTGGGSIINIGSIVSEYGNMGQVNYAASKGGVVGLTRSLAKEMALFSHKVAKIIPDDSIHRDKQGVAKKIPPAIRVNCIQPGFIHTPMVHAVPNKILSEMKQRIALKRLGRAEDVANLALFLASNARSGYITGEVLECSGMLRL
ncbi:hypothetical protein ACHAXM_001141 [Skeletonema potamos]